MKARKKVATFMDLSGAIHCLVVPARTSDRRLRALAEAAKERADQIAHVWACLRAWAHHWQEASGDPPPWFKPDDGPERPVPVIRGILWAAENDPNARTWLEMLEALLAQDPLALG